LATFSYALISEIPNSTEKKYKRFENYFKLDFLKSMGTFKKIKNIIFKNLKELFKHTSTVFNPKHIFRLFFLICKNCVKGHTLGYVLKSHEIRML